ncbi:bone morphogenetic 3 [Brachionus plicatilis]|uniref:Bone morphogenetic 3 n=1 Tax=Brachionus plicatilis TaxID=10195 RepID=A0A3M7R725_BRAPC|nr:bone morphogenetic 3 [Brachionus plicatilis]
MILLSLFFIYFVSASHNQSSIKNVESTKNPPPHGFDSARILAHLSKIGHPAAKSDTFDLSSYDFERLTEQPIVEKPRKYPLFRSAQIDQKTRGLEQLRAMYQVLKNGETIHKNPETNTIRFIPSIRIVNNNRASFIFNLSMLGDSEKVLSAELYLNRRLLRHRPLVNLHYHLSNSSNLDEVVAQILNSTVSSVIDLSGFRHRRRRSNWHAFDLADSVSSFLATRFNRFKLGQINNNFINKNFYYTLDNEVSKQSELEDLMLMIDSDRFRNVHPRLAPYLIVYSHEHDEEMRNFFQNRLPTDLLDDRAIPQNNVHHESAQVYHSKDSSIKLIETKSFDGYGKNKSNLFNYLPDYKQNLNLHNIELIFKDHYRRRRDLESPEVYNEANETNLLLPWDDERWNHDLNETKKEIVKCQTKPLIIDFQDLSFSSWIIEPKRFQGNYCDGSCKYPYNKEVSFSNYAALQSILNSINLSVNNGAPELCCTPSSTSKIPIFYKDLNSVDYVVKYLPDMVVTECACR